MELKQIKFKQINFLAGLLLGGLMNGIASADDIDIYAAGSSVSTSHGKPNILFIIDTSGSMTDPASGATSEFATYDATIVYLGECGDDSYWFTSNAPTSTSLGINCTSTQKINVENFHCGASIDEINASGFSSPRWYFQWRASGASTYEWQSMTSSPGAPGLPNTDVDCIADSGNHGHRSTNTTTKPYIKEDSDLTTTEKQSSTGAWSSNPAEEETSSYSTQWRFYSGNYMNWYTNYKSGMNRITAVKHALTAQSTDPGKQGLLRTLSDVSIGFMRFDAGTNNPDANGGMVIQEIRDLAGNQQAMIETVLDIQVKGNTPLAESLVEGVRYYMGQPVYFGDDTQAPDPADPDTLIAFDSVPASRDSTDPGLYSSPIIGECQMNHIVLLTDGEPTDDNESDNSAELLPDWNSEGPTGVEWIADCRGADDDYPEGSCLDDIAAYAYQTDLSTQNGPQNAITHAIGFDISTSEQLMKETAKKGGGGYYSVTNTDTFKQAVQEILKDVIDRQSSFNAPAVSVNAFNRTRHSDDLYFTLFSPQDSPHWDGNLKKFNISVQDGKAVIIGADNQPAVNDQTGFFKDTAASFWSAAIELPDGGDAAKGGASSVLPANRRIYTDAENPNTFTLTEFLPTNALITDTALGVPATARDEHIDWIRGIDVDDANGNSDTTEARRARNMGDPLHSRPAVITYGGTISSPDSTIYFGTNDGFLHAVDADTGIEVFAFTPKSLWQNFTTLRTNSATQSKIYGIDTPIVPFVHDVDLDGVIEPTDDFVYLYFGLRRGGRNYYALDVSDRSSPKLLWMIDPSVTGFGDLGYTFAEPALGRVQLHGDTTPSDVLFLSGGFDTTTQDNDETVNTVDTMGNALYVVNAKTGALIWHAGDLSSGANFTHAMMTSGIPARPRVIDLNGDGITDRLYVGDMGGRVWRFDVNDVSDSGNGNLLTGGVIASLGAGHLSSPTVNDLPDHRQFMNTPDIALVDDKDLGRYLTIAIGSGERQHPNQKSTTNRFYVLKDPNVDTTLANSEFSTEYGNYGVTHQELNALIDLTATNLDETSSTDISQAKASKGWFMDMPLTGEKVLAEAVTVKDQLIFTSFTPTESSGSCDPGLGLGRIYAVSLKYGKALFDQNGDGDADDLADRGADLKLKGIPPALTILFPDATNGDVVGLVGTEESPIDLNLPPKRTYWYEETETE